MPSFLNAAENMLGICFAIIYRSHFQRDRPNILHAVWATAPATAGMLLSKLTGIPFSLEAHAYDVYENDGDWLLRSKIEQAKFIRTSTQMVQDYLERLGVSPNKIVLARRGFDSLPKKGKIREQRTPIRILSIGRLIEKKGSFTTNGYLFCLKKGFHSFYC